MSINFKSPSDQALAIAKQSQAKRLSLNLSQQTLSDRSGVSFGTIKNFERTGNISLKSLLKIAITLGALDDFDNVFKDRPQDLPATLSELIQENTRKRGRQ